MKKQNRYLHFLVDPSSQELNRSFLLSLEDDVARVGHARYFPSTVEIEDYNVMIDEQNLFNHMITFERLKLVRDMITQQVVY